MNLLSDVWQRNGWCSGLLMRCPVLGGGGGGGGGREGVAGGV